MDISFLQCKAIPQGTSRNRRISMNTDQVKGALKEAAGKVQQIAGEVLNSPEQQARGLAKQVEGSVQKTYGLAKEKVRGSKK